MKDDELPDTVEFYTDGFVKNNPGILIAYDAELAMQNLVKIPPMMAELDRKMKKEENEIVIISGIGDYIVYFEAIGPEIFMIFFPTDTSDADIMKVLPTPVMLPYIKQVREQLRDAVDIQFPKIRFISADCTPHLDVPDN
jgi:hypothetical protein